MIPLQVYHETVYRYDRPVLLGEQILRLRPRDSHDLRLLDARLEITPAATLRWMHDVFGNSVARATTWERTTEFRVASTLLLEHYETPPLDESDSAGFDATKPVYPPDVQIDLGAMLNPHYDDSEGRLRTWAARFIPAQPAEAGPLQTLIAIVHGIRQELDYLQRHEHGVQAPLETLDLGSGTCRDFAVLMMEAARALGFGARFATGYLYDDGRASDGGSIHGTGATHAWAEIYLPGAGWVEFDPTNGGVGNHNLVRVAVAREPWQATPIEGTFISAPGVAAEMDVRVAVTRAESTEQ